MSEILLGNLTLEEFEKRTGARFTDEEKEYLRSVHSGKAKLQSAEDWHIFDIPFNIVVGSTKSKTLQIFVAANDRKKFKVPVSVKLDKNWS